MHATGTLNLFIALHHAHHDHHCKDKVQTNHSIYTLAIKYQDNSKGGLNAGESIKRCTDRYTQTRAAVARRRGIKINSDAVVTAIYDIDCSAKTSDDCSRAETRGRKNQMKSLTRRIPFPDCVTVMECVDE